MEFAVTSQETISKCYIMILNEVRFTFTNRKIIIVKQFVVFHTNKLLLTQASVKFSKNCIFLMALKPSYGSNRKKKFKLHRLHVLL